MAMLVHDKETASAMPATEANGETRSGSTTSPVPPTSDAPTGLGEASDATQGLMAFKSDAPRDTSDRAMLGGTRDNDPIGRQQLNFPRFEPLPQRLESRPCPPPSPQRANLLDRVSAAIGAWRDRVRSWAHRS